MESYVVSARKYRPATFDSVVGQPALTTTLRNAVRTGKLAHAYLFCGPRGVGKTTCARIFAKTINCLNPTAEGEACDECESCLAMREQRSLNIHELDAASNNSVDDIRQLVEQVRIPPQIGRYKVYIIDEVHMLSASAFNAFLKTLEEPPRHAIFILATTEKHKILPTILSRCQIYDFQRIGIEDTVAHLAYVAAKEGITAEPEALGIIALKADGGMRDALSIFDQVAAYSAGHITYQSTIENLNVLDYEYYFRLVDLLLQGDVAGSLLLLDDVLRRGFDAQQFVTGLASHLRDVLVSRDAATVSLLEVGASIRERYLEQAGRCPLPFVYQGMKLANDCDLAYRTSRNKRLLVELTLIQMAQLVEGGAGVAGQPGGTGGTGTGGQTTTTGGRQGTTTGTGSASRPTIKPIKPAAQGAGMVQEANATGEARPQTTTQATKTTADTTAVTHTTHATSSAQPATPTVTTGAQDNMTTTATTRTQAAGTTDTATLFAKGSAERKTVPVRKPRAMGFSIKAARGAVEGNMGNGTGSGAGSGANNGPASSTTSTSAVGGTATQGATSSAPSQSQPLQLQSQSPSQQAPAAPRPVTEELANQAWQDYAASLPREQTALMRRMQGMHVGLLEDGLTLDVVVDNDMAAHDFSSIISPLQAFLRPRLDNSAVTVKVRVSAPQETTRVYNRVERYQMMCEQNPALKDLTEALGLEFY